MGSCKIGDVDINIVYSSEEKNILKVNTKKEIFFEVYECAIGNEKIILEKTDTLDETPIVTIDFIDQGKIFTCEALLIESEESELIVNEENLYFLKDEKNLKNNIFIENIDNTTETAPTSSTNIIDETKIEIQHTYDEKIQEYENKKYSFLTELEEQFETKIDSLKDDLSDKLDLFFDKLDKKKDEILEEKLKEIHSDIENKINIFKNDIENLEDFSKKNINNILEKKIGDIDLSVNDFLKNITENYSKKFKNNDKKVTGNILNLKSLSEKVNKTNNIYDTRFSELSSLKEKLYDQDELIVKNKELLEFINEEFNSINNKFLYLSEEENKKYNDLLATVNKKDVVEYKTILKEKIQEVELTQIKEVLQEEISDALRGDITALKRYVEMSSGGGTVAMQFARGGTMDGDLNVTGNFLSGGQNLSTIFNTDTTINLQDVTDNGNTTTNSISTNNTIIAHTIKATSLLSATNIDIGFELSGFNATGSISASEGLSARNIHGVEIFDNGNRVCTSIPAFNLQSVTDAGNTTTNIISTNNTLVTPSLSSNAQGNAKFLGQLFEGNNRVCTSVPAFNLQTVTDNGNTTTNIISTNKSLSANVVQGNILFEGNNRVCTSEVDTLATVTGRGATTTTAISSNNNIIAKTIKADGSLSGASLGLGVTPTYDQTRAIKVHDNGVQFASRVSLIGTGDNAGPGLEFVTDGSLNKRTLIRHEGESGTNDYGLSFFATNNGTVGEKVRFSGNGHVGIGTSSPILPLQVESTINALTDTDEPENYHLLLRNPNNDNNEGVGIGFLISELTNDVGASIIFKRTDSNAKGELQFFNKQNVTADGVMTQSMTIDDTGKVGVGTTSPVANFQIGDASAAQTFLILGPNGNTSSSQLLFGDNAATTDPFEAGMGIRYDSSNNRMYFDDNYNGGGSANNTIMTIDRDTQRVGIGTVTPSKDLHVSGTTRLAGTTEIAGALSTNNIIVTPSLSSNPQNNELRIISQNGNKGGKISIGHPTTVRAIGNNSFAAGGGYDASGGGGPAGFVKACGNGSVALGGTGTLAKGNYSVALPSFYGIPSRACGHYSIAAGGGLASGQHSVSLGRYSSSTGYASFSFGGYSAAKALAKGAIAMGGTLYSTTQAKGNYSTVIGGGGKGGGGSGVYCHNIACADSSAIIGGRCNTIFPAHSGSMILGSNLRSVAKCTVVVNNLSAQCNVQGSIIHNPIIEQCTGSFILSLSDNGKHIYLNTSSNTINVTVNCITSGFNATFVKESGTNPVVFGSGFGLSSLNSFENRRTMGQLYSQSSIMFKTNVCAFLGGNLQ